jgi:TRAP-type mannitol/chloroaromatic compound transport system permease small subunit
MGALTMYHGIKKAADRIDRISERLGETFCYLVFVIMLITTIDVLARYAFNRPLLWGWLLNRQLFGVFILFAGVYAMCKRVHIRIEILYDYFPPKMKLVAKIVALVCFILFMGVLVWQAGWMGLNSLSMMEKASGAFRIPLYPFKLLICVIAFLFLLEGIVILSRSDD